MEYIDYRKYIRSKDWYKRKKEYILLNWDLCWVCKAKWSNLHHRNYNSLWKEDFNDLIFLCRKCHKKIHFWFNGYYNDKRFYIKEEELRQREYFANVLYNKSDQDYINLNKDRLDKLAYIWRTNINIQKNIWCNFIKKYSLEVFVDFCSIYKEIWNVKDIFEIYWIEEDKSMMSSFIWVLWHWIRYWYCIDDIIGFIYKYKYKN